MKHTPGPWTHHTLDGADERIFTVTNSSGKYLADIHERLTYPETEANATLIAAAPDMLEALKSILDLLSNNDTFGAKFSSDKARAAIAKATS